MIRHIVIGIAAFCLFANQTKAQESYDIEECRQLALANNVKMRNADNAVKAARQAEREAFTKYFPSVNVPLSGWWGGSHAIKKEKWNVMDAEILMRDQSKQLIIGMQQSWNDLSDAHKKMLIARESIEQATENLRLHEDYYRAGTTTMSDLLEAQILYQQSRDSYVEAFSAFKIKTVEYLQATGR